VRRVGGAGFLGQLVGHHEDDLGHQFGVYLRALVTADADIARSWHII
jgi:hypothetical protein